MLRSSGEVRDVVGSDVDEPSSVERGDVGGDGDLRLRLLAGRVVDPQGFVGRVVRHDPTGLGVRQLRAVELRRAVPRDRQRLGRITAGRGHGRDRVVGVGASGAGRGAGRRWRWRWRWRWRDVPSRFECLVEECELEVGVGLRRISTVPQTSLATTSHSSGSRTHDPVPSGFRMAITGSAFGPKSSSGVRSAPIRSK